MAANYIGRMQELEGRYRAYIRKADYQHSIAGGYTQEEGKCLQEASNLQYEMAQISDGEARAFHLRQRQQIEERLAEVIKAVSPDMYDRIIEEREKRKHPQKAESETTEQPTKAAKQSSSKSESVSDEEIENWFKPMPKHSFEDVSGMSELKEQLQGCISGTHVKLRSYLKMPELHSFLFIGPPGCGKSYIIEAFAHELMDKDYKYISLEASDIHSRFVGKAEKLVSRLFEEAEKNAPCIVFIDEIDGVCRNRSDDNLPEWASALTTSFLVGYNRIKSSDKPIIFIGATNYPNRVDNAMLDRVQLIRVPFPDADARTHAFRMQLEDMIALEPGLSFDDLGAMTEMYNYRDIDRLISIVKDSILEDVISIYEDEEQAVRMLENRSYFLTRELFVKAFEAYTPTPKDDIVRMLDEWEASIRSSREQKG